MHSRSRAINEGLWHEGSEHPLSKRYLFNQGPGGHDVIGRMKSVDRTKINFILARTTFMVRELYLDPRLF